MQEFSIAVEKIRRHEIIKKAEAVIEHYPLAKEDSTIVPSFWRGIGNLLSIMNQKTHKDPTIMNEKTHNEQTIYEIESLIRLKHSWVLMSKGPNVKLLGRGDRMLATAVDFEIWKEKVLEKAGFDVAFKEYYDRRGGEFPDDDCAVLQLENYPADTCGPIYCPDQCGRYMEIASVSYKCCHGHADHHNLDAPDHSGTVQIEKRS